MWLQFIFNKGFMNRMFNIAVHIISRVKDHHKPYIKTIIDDRSFTLMAIQNKSFLIQNLFNTALFFMMVSRKSLKGFLANTIQYDEFQNESLRR